MQTQYIGAEKGDIIDFYDNELNYIGSAQTVSLDKDEITFDELPENALDAYVLQNTAYCPKTEIVNCKIKRGRARGLLIQTKNASVKECTFEQLALPAILIAPDITQWYEMGPCKNAAIESCSFINCSYAMKGGVINISDGHDASLYAAGASDIHGSVKITDCRFENCTAAAVTAKRCADLVTDSNRFINSDETVDIKE